MASVAHAPPAPRYGSVAELAAYAGLSRKTIRRLIEAGSIRGLKVGRRVLIPFADLDRHIHRSGRPRAPMAMVPSPPAAVGSVDPGTGRLLPQTEAQRRERSSALARALDEMAAITDETDTDEVWAEVMQGIDETRPHRPLFGPGAS